MHKRREMGEKFHKLVGKAVDAAEVQCAQSLQVAFTIPLHYNFSKQTQATGHNKRARQAQINELRQASGRAYAVRQLRAGPLFLISNA